MFFSKKLQKFENLKHCFFSRKNGFSNGYYESLNCGMGSSDNKENVLKNLEFVSNKIGCKKESLITLNQTHSNKVIYLEKKNEIKDKMQGDAIITKIKNICIGILTADCVPILLYDPQKKIIGSIHAGWKGALNGVIKNTILKFLDLKSETKDLIAVVGPCIKKENYEVKSDFYEKFIAQNNENNKFFEKINDNQFVFDLRAFVNSEINNFNVKNLENIEKDTFSEKETFFSYRRSLFNKEKDYGRCISVILMT